MAELDSNEGKSTSWPSENSDCTYTLRFVPPHNSIVRPGQTCAWQLRAGSNLNIVTKGRAKPEYGNQGTAKLGFADNIYIYILNDPALHSSPSQNIARPGRLLVREGTLQKMCRKAAKDRYFFLFNDALVFNLRIESNVFLNIKCETLFDLGGYIIIFTCVFQAERLMLNESNFSTFQNNFFAIQHI